MLEKIKNFIIALIIFILIFSFPFILLYLELDIESPHMGIKCFGNCHYQIIHNYKDNISKDEIYFNIIDSYSHEVKIENIDKYKENKRKHKIYLIRKSDYDDLEYIYTIFDYKNSKIKNYDNLDSMNYRDRKIFENEKDFVDLMYKYLRGDFHIV